MGQKLSSNRSSHLSFIKQGLFNKNVRSKTTKRGKTAKPSRRNRDCGLESKCPHRLDTLLDMPSVGLDEQQKHGWNSEDKSTNLTIKNNGLTLQRGQVGHSTDCARGKVGFSHGLHCWEITWNPEQRGSHAMIGVCTDSAALNCPGYRPLVGRTNESWGLDLERNQLYHGGKIQRNEKKTDPASIEPNETYTLPEKVIVVLDMDEGTLSFVADNQYLGVAFTGLKGKTLYPIISCVWGNCEVGIKYINGLERKPLSLADLSRRTIRMSVGKNNLDNNVPKLPLPHLLQEYILYR